MSTLQVFLTLGWLATTLFATFTLLVFWSIFPRDNGTSITKHTALKASWTVAGLVHTTVTLTALVLLLQGFNQFLAMQKAGVIVLIILSGPILGAIAHAALWLGRRRKRLEQVLGIDVGDIFKPLANYKLATGEKVHAGRGYKTIHGLGSLRTLRFEYVDPEEGRSVLEVSVSEMLNMLLPGTLTKLPTVTNQGQS